MALPSYTETGWKWRREYLESLVYEIEHSENSPNWLSMYQEIIEYTFALEERVRRVEEKLSELT